MNKLIPLLVCLSFSASLKCQQQFHRSLELMGCKFDLTVVAASEQQGNTYLNLAVNEIRRIEHLISSWDANSQTTAINHMAGIKPVVVDEELFALIDRSVALSRLTSGAFDISYASMDQIWYFDGTMKSMPTPAEIAASVAKVGYQQIVLNPEDNSVLLTQKGSKIGFGAIGKGYAADRAKMVLEAQGVIGGIINASGDIAAWGHQPDGSPWTVGITNPRNARNAFAWLPVDNRAVVTSGDYERFVSFDGVRYAHIIDPRTGYPATGIVSVTVFAPKAELADALATAIFVMGLSTGLDFINQLPNVDAIIVDNDNQVHTSQGITLKNPYSND